MFSSNGPRTHFGPYGSPWQGMPTGIRIAVGTGVFVATAMLAGCASTPSEDDTSSSSVTEPAPTEEEEAEETEEAESEPDWDSEQVIADIRDSLENGEFPELAEVQLQADGDDPGHVTVIADEDTPLMGDVGVIVGDTCEDVPEVERVTVVYVDGSTVGPIDTSCQG